MTLGGCRAAAGGRGGGFYSKARRRDYMQPECFCDRGAGGKEDDIEEEKLSAAA